MGALIDILNKLREAYPNAEIHLWTKSDRGKFIVDNHDIIKFNLDMVEAQLASGDPEMLDNIFRYFAEVIEKKYLNRKGRFGNTVGRKAFNLTQAQIEFAIANTKSNAAASKFLGVNPLTYRKYARLYGLYDLHSNPYGFGTNKGRPGYRTPMQDIFDNKHPKVHVTLLKRRLITEQYLVERCEICGFNEKRVSDGQVPLLVDWKDGNHKNFARENLRLICYNHAMLVRGRLNIKQIRFTEKQFKEMQETRADIDHPEIFDEAYNRFNPKV